MLRRTEGSALNSNQDALVSLMWGRTTEWLQNAQIVTREIFRGHISDFTCFPTWLLHRRRRWVRCAEGGVLHRPCGCCETEKSRRVRVSTQRAHSVRNTSELRDIHQVCARAVSSGHR